MNLQTANNKKLLIAAGETSGDFYAASLIDVLKKEGCYDIYAVGGPQTAKRDVKLLFDSSNWAAIGILEAIKQAPKLFMVYNRLTRFLREEKPDLVILVDYPGFNMRLVHAAKKLNIPTLYYFPPSKFAKDASRVKDAAESITLVAANFAATYKIYQKAGANVEFVGHPLLDQTKPTLTKQEALKEYALDPNRPLIGLCPGSRKSELVQLLPIMLKAGSLICQKNPKFQFAVPIIKTEGSDVFGVSKEALKKQIAESKIPVVLAEGKISNVMQLADLLLISAGTATLEAAFMGVPMIICYRVNLFTEIQARFFYNLPRFVGLPNIILERMAVPEMIQHDLTPELLADKALEILNSKTIYDKQKQDLKEVITHLGPIGAHERVAQMIKEMLFKPQK